MKRLLQAQIRGYGGQADLLCMHTATADLPHQRLEATQCLYGDAMPE